MGQNNQKILWRRPNTKLHFFTPYLPLKKSNKFNQNTWTQNVNWCEWLRNRCFWLFAWWHVHSFDFFSAEIYFTKEVQGLDPKSQLFWNRQTKQKWKWWHNKIIKLLESIQWFLILSEWIKIGHRIQHTTLILSNTTGKMPNLNLFRQHPSMFWCNSQNTFSLYEASKSIPFRIPQKLENLFPHYMYFVSYGFIEKKFILWIASLNSRE